MLRSLTVQDDPQHKNGLPPAPPPPSLFLPALRGVRQLRQVFHQGEEPSALGCSPEKRVPTPHQAGGAEEDVALVRAENLNF